MQNSLLHSTLNILQYLINANPAATQEVIKLLNQSTGVPAKTLVRYKIKNTCEVELLKKKYWSKEDRKQATQFVKLPTSLHNFLTQNNML
jgi:hypothetical protein